MSVELLPFGLESPHFDEAVAIYTEYVTHGTTVSHQAFFADHSLRKGYVGLVARVDECIVGVAFGSASQAGQWWHDKVADHVGPHHPALQKAWVLTQLNVLAAYRNRGIGAQLHDAIIDKQTRSNLLLSTPVANTSAQRFYERRGWHFLHRGFQFSKNDQSYAILHQTLTAKADC